MQALRGCAVKGLRGWVCSGLETNRIVVASISAESVAAAFGANRPSARPISLAFSLSLGRPLPPPVAAFFADILLSRYTFAIMARFLAVIGLSVGLLAAGPKAEQIDAIFEKVDRTNVPGCALGVTQNGHLQHARGYGMADLDHDIANTPRTVFHVASMSKQITAAAVTLLAQRGKLDLDDPVRDHIPELPDFGTPITIRHLIHHVSGLRDQWSLLVMSGWRLSEDVVRDEDVMDLVSRMKALNFRPGEMHLYSNTGYTLLGQIVKRVTGKSLRQFTQKEIFEPLGMRDTHFRDDHQETVKGMAYGYNQTGRVWKQSIPHYDTVGASSLLTTVEDWAKWERNFDDPKVGGKALVEQMLAPFTLNSGGEDRLPVRPGGWEVPRFGDGVA